MLLMRCHLTSLPYQHSSNMAENGELVYLLPICWLKFIIDFIFSMYFQSHYYFISIYKNLTKYRIMPFHLNFVIINLFIVMTNNMENFNLLAGRSSSKLNSHIWSKKLRFETKKRSILSIRNTLLKSQKFYIYWNANDIYRKIGETVKQKKTI